jgi:hypothetical protein
VPREGEAVAGVAGHRERLELEARQGDPGPGRQRLGQRGDATRADRRAEDAQVRALAPELHIAADVVGVVVGAEDGHQIEVLRLRGAQHGARVSRVHHGGRAFTGSVHEVRVVVREAGDDGHDQRGRFHFASAA